MLPVGIGSTISAGLKAPHYSQLAFLLVAVNRRSCMPTRYFKLSYAAAISRRFRDRADDAAATWVERGEAEKERI
jgi:hypothetical protein